MILYLKDLKNLKTTPKSLDIINTFSKITEYNINFKK
jgi:hypothetical protein